MFTIPPDARLRLLCVMAFVFSISCACIVLYADSRVLEYRIAKGYALCMRAVCFVQGALGRFMLDECALVFWIMPASPLFHVVLKSYQQYSRSRRSPLFRKQQQPRWGFHRTLIWIPGYTCIA